MKELNQNLKILVITPRLPIPPIGGDKLRIYNQCKLLSKSHKISLISLHDNSISSKPPKNKEFFEDIWIINQSKWNKLFYSFLALLSGKPIQIGFFYNPRLKKFISKYGEEFDILICHLIRTAEYAQYFKGIKYLEMTDALSLTYKRSSKISVIGNLKSLAYFIERSRVRRYELNIIDQFTKSFVVSEIDKNYLSNQSGNSRGEIIVAGNGINIKKYPFQYQSINKDQKLRIVFVGMMNTLQNFDAARWFATEILPSILLQKDVVFEIYGKISNKTRSILANHKGVQVKGEFKNISIALKGAHIGICPMRIGAGVQNKILEYMALGIPTITTSIGLEGINAKPEFDLLVADTPEDFYKKINELINNPILAKKLARNSRNLIETNFSWEKQLIPFTESVSQNESKY